MMDLPHHPESAPEASGTYDSRYLLGALYFNQGEYFEAHEVWEELWMDCLAADRRFYQSLIQAAVALYHWGNGNRAGALRLFDSGRRYMAPYRPAHKGLDVDQFWGQVQKALALALIEPPPEGREVAPGKSPPSRPHGGENVTVQPRIALDPPPDHWPAPELQGLADPTTPGATHE